MRKLYLERCEERILFATDLLTELVPPANSSFPKEVGVANELAYFLLTDPEHVSTTLQIGHLHRTDGTPGGTFSVHPDPERISDFSNSVAIGDKFFYQISLRLYVTSGTADTTVELTNDERGVYSPSPMFAVGDHVYFVGVDWNAPSPSNYALMRTDGTLEGTENVSPETTGQRRMRIQGVFNGELIYQVDDSPVLSSLRVEEAEPSEVPSELPLTENVQIFASLGDYWIGTIRGELALIDRANEFNLTTVDLYERSKSSPTNFLATSQRVYFTAFTTEGFAVFETDGTADGTRAISEPDLNNESYPRELIWFQDQLFFSTDFKLQRYDPATQTVEALFEFRQTTASESRLRRSIQGPTDFTIMGDELYFVANSEAGRGIWKSDGSPAGTQFVVDVYPGKVGSNPTALEVLGDDLLFAATHPEIGNEYWTLDTLTGEVQLLADLQKGHQDIDPYETAFFELYEASQGVIFEVITPARGREPWVTDGTAEGTSLLVDTVPGLEDSRLVPRETFDGTFYFAAGESLWATDGTPVGTEQIATKPDGTYSFSESLVEWNGRVYFLISSPQQRELWSTEGTVATTRLETPAPLGEGTENSTLLYTPQGVLLMTDGFLQLWNGEELEPLFSEAQTLGSQFLDAITWQDEILLRTRNTIVRYGANFDRFENIYRFINYHHSILLPDGSGIVLDSGRGLYLYDLATREIEQLSTRSLEAVRFIGDRLVGVERITVEGVPVERLYGMRMEDESLSVIQDFADTEQTFVDDGRHYAVVRRVGRSDWTLVEITADAQVVDIMPAERSSPGSHYVIFDDLLIYTSNFSGRTHWSTPVPQNDVELDSGLIDALFAAVRTPSTSPGDHLDRNDDNTIDDLDIEFVFDVELETSRADLDLNGKVEFADFLILSANFGATDGTWSEGDLSGDGTIGFADFLLLSADFGFERGVATQ